MKKQIPVCDHKEAKMVSTNFFSIYVMTFVSSCTFKYLSSEPALHFSLYPNCFKPEKKILVQNITKPFVLKNTVEYLISSQYQLVELTSPLFVRAAIIL